MDLRIPVAIMFTLLGGILTAYGILAPHDTGQVHLGLRVNLIWGLVMCCFGLVLGTMAWRSRRRG